MNTLNALTVKLVTGKLLKFDPDQWVEFRIDDTNALIIDRPDGKTIYAPGQWVAAETKRVRR